MKAISLIVTIFALSMTAFGAETGSQGAQGDAGLAGQNGASGTITLFGLKCVVSTNLEHLKMCLDEGKSVNQLRSAGTSIFQSAIESGDIPMLLMVVNNPDPKNKPDLRVRYTNVKVGTQSLNDYQLLLLERVVKNQNWEPVEIDEEKLKDSLYVDENQVARLKILLTVENDPIVFKNETHDILVALEGSKLNNAPSVQEAIALLKIGPTN